MKIAAVQFNDIYIVLTIQSKYEGLTVRLPRDISIAALGRHLVELQDLLS